MITITIYKKNEEFKGFSCTGHAEFAENGKDIVCAAVSVLVINTLNALDALTDNEIAVKTLSSEHGIISASFENSIDEKGILLMQSMILGLQEIKKQYSKKYLKLKFEEV